MQTEPRVEGEEIKYYDLVESRSAIDSGCWDMLPDSFLCSYSHVNFDSKDKEYSFQRIFSAHSPWNLSLDSMKRILLILGIEIDMRIGA